MSAQKKYCLECFAIIDAELETCSQCGYVQPTEYNPLYLKPPFRLNRQYVIGKVLGHGGFGITYLGFDRHLNTRVAIKEYFPAEFASRAPDGQQVIPYSGDKSELFKLGRDKFIAEARLLASLRSPHIVRIRHFFEECNTAYFIMEYLEGNTLSQHVANQGGRIKPEKIKGLLLPLLEALEEVHAKNSFHRDIKPDNVYVTSKGQPILLDFGAARQQMSGATTNLLAFLTPGFAPAEQYSTNGIQGPWTDIYALAATMYYALTGNIPPVPHDRMMGDQELIRPSALGVQISPKDEEWLIQGLALKWSQRPENIAQWRKLIEAADNTAAPMNNFKRSEEENFMRIAILPRLVSRFLTPTAEAEIHESAGFMEISRERVETLIEEALMMTGSTRRDPDAEKRKEQERRKQLEEDLKRRQAREAADEAHRQEQRQKQEAEKKRQEEEELQRKQAEQERQRKQDEEKRTTERAQQETARREEALRQSQKQQTGPAKEPVAEAPKPETPGKGKPHKPPPATPPPAAPPPTADIPPAAKVKAPPRFTNLMGMDFVLVEPEAQAFQMGKADNHYNVILSRAYYLQTTPITQGQWRMVMGINPSRFQGDEWRPVEQVSWDDCQIFIQRLNSLKEGNYRLPTEAEWEYACRWGQKTAYGFGDTEEELLENGWFDRNSEGGTHPVGLKKPNKWGLYDMHGNVWEWTQDRFSAFPTGTFTDPKGSDSGASRVMRGGSWNLGASYCRAESRNYEIPSYRFQNLGFRLLLEIKI